MCGFLDRRFIKSFTPLFAINSCDDFYGLLHIDASVLADQLRLT